LKFIDTWLLEFTEVHVVLDSIIGNPKFSSYAKLWVIAQQTMPFIHIDNDVYLMKPLSIGLLNLPVFCQSAEPIESPAYPFYNEIFGNTVININNPVLNAYNLLPLSIRKASNIGIIGGTTVTGGLVDFANAAMDILNTIDITGYSDANFELVDLYISQYYLTAHYTDMMLTIHYAINDIFDKTEVTNKCYIRPLGMNKSNEMICERIEKTYFNLI